MMDANANHSPATQDNLSSYFERSATIVRHYADLIEHDYAQPILHYASLKFKQKPITMTFLSVFAALSLLPLLSFVGLTVFALCSITFLAFISAAVVFIAIEAILATCLVFMLWTLFIVAGFATAVVVLVYWITRLGILLSVEGPSGVSDWTHETRQYFFYSRGREPTEDSDGSAVLVDKDGPNSKKIKAEDEAN